MFASRRDWRRWTERVAVLCSLGQPAVVQHRRLACASVRMARRTPVHCIHKQPWTAGARLEDSVAANGRDQLLTSAGPGLRLWRSLPEPSALAEASGHLLTRHNTWRRVPPVRPRLWAWPPLVRLGSGLGLALLWWRSPPALRTREPAAHVLLHLGGGLSATRRPCAGSRGGLLLVVPSLCCIAG